MFLANTELMLHMSANIPKGRQAVASVGGRFCCTDQKAKRTKLLSNQIRLQVLFLLQANSPLLSLLAPLN